MNLLYKDPDNVVMIDFYKKPAELELDHNGERTRIDCNGLFLGGNESHARILAKWLLDADDEFDEIIWEWNIGNDDFSPIQLRLNV